ncbi:MAG: hypothetical protein U5L03_01300 [Burkholderiaceae bacterium]|nr:hypothetical protein [Burkholderiaceae bacterium]
MHRVVAGCVMACTASFSNAGALDDVMKMQKNGMWELKLPGQKGKPLLFCVTDTTKIGGLKETQESVKSLGCKTEKESLKGDQYEIVLACSNADPNLGNFRMVMKGTARPDYSSGTTTVTGGGPMIKGLFPSGQEGGSEDRWLRPCKAGEKPGLQEGK